ncbi:MAG TPA: SMP-30/gluconolactonase/LRE family protein [Planctomycetota bacterium]|nr:SMP-30/gluconolactonase/LRE family protein [Planctomycetota bacterium]
MIVTMLLCCLAQSDLAAGEPKKLAGDMKFTEGPVADGKGKVYYSDIPANRIMVWDGKENKVWREDSGGANGLKIDKDGNLVACEGGNRRITRIAIADQKVTVLADAFDGKKLNSPNDLAIDAKGGIYFSDPRYGKRDGMELDKEAVYYILPGGGKTIRVADDLTRPNGVHIDKDKIYIADTGTNKTWVYGMNDDGTLKDKKEFVAKGSDGVKVDEKGNVYLATGGKIEIFAPDAKPLGSIAMPEVEVNGKKVHEGPANLVFDGKTLFITARTGFYSVDMKVAGQ